MSAEATYMSALFALLSVLLWAAAVDATLFFRQELTVSAWIRLHRDWILWPICIDLVAMAGLILHIFVFTD